MKSQMWLLLISFLLVCGTIGRGAEPKPAAEEPHTVVSKLDVTEEPGSSGEITNSIGMNLKLIPAGEFMMGSPESDGDAYSFENPPQHEVRITQPFYLGVTEVTQEQYEKVMEKNLSQYKDTANPVEMVSWDDAVEFCKRLSAKEGNRYRLPTEAEYSFGDDAASLDEYAWFSENSERKTHPVGQKKPNPWGLTDMHGNVWEWCQDRYVEYSSDAVSDPPGDDGTAFRVIRGGAWDKYAKFCRSANRFRYSPGLRYDILGFRVARDLSSD